MVTLKDSNSKIESIVFLVSGGGSTLQVIHEFFKLNPEFNLKVTGVLADRECRALDIAKSETNLLSKLVRYSQTEPKALREALTELNPDRIITNIHKIIDVDTVNLFQGKLINLHYSLLPAFGGLIGDKAVKASIKSGCKFLGTTVHAVSEHVDAGEIISQSILLAHTDHSFEALMNRVFQSGCANLINSLIHLKGASNSIPSRRSQTPKSDSPGIDDLGLFSPDLLFSPAELRNVFAALEKS